MVEILEKYKIFSKKKAMMNIPLCHMVLMVIVHLTFKIDILKMNEAFQMGYKEGDKVSYLFFTNWKGKEDLIDEHEPSWNIYWQVENGRFN
jgi:hypothetical protein